MGKFYFAMGSGHDIPADRPDLTIKTVGQMLDVLEGKTVVRLEEEALPQIKEQTRFFVDGELANYVRDNAQGKGKHEKLKEFCRQLGLGFGTYKDFGYTDDRRSGIMGYYVVCK